MTIYYDIRQFGAVGDGITDSSEAIAQAIEACSAAGGGTVYIPAGTYYTRRIILKSNLTLELATGATLLFSNNFDHYPPVRTRWSGYECWGYSPLIYGSDLTNVVIKGGGTIDGQGHPWWEANSKLRSGGTVDSIHQEELRRLNAELIASVNSNIAEWKSQFFRPPLLQLINCEKVAIEGVTLQNSPFWNTHLVYCRNVRVSGVTIRNPHDTPNGDGLDLDSCSNVRVSDCHFDVGDDCLVIKSGIDEDGRRVGKPSEHIAISNCTMLRGHGGVVFGSEMSGGIRNVVISNCIFIGTDRGIRMKTNRARGGYIKNVLVNNIYMENVFCPIAINSFYRYGVDETDPLINSTDIVPLTEGTPLIKHLRISNVTAKNCRAAAGFIYGLPEMPIKDVALHQVTLEMTTDPNEQGDEPDMVKDRIVMAGEGMLCKHVEGLSLFHVNIETRQGPALRLEQVKETEIVALNMRKRHANTPVIQIERSKNVYITKGIANRSDSSYLAADEVSLQYVHELS